MMTGEKTSALTDQHRIVFAKRKILATDRESVADLWEPFRDAYVTHVRPAETAQSALLQAFRHCAQAMLALDCPYWAFTWDGLLAWRSTEQARQAAWPTGRRRIWDQFWREMTATLFFLDILPYRETIYQHYHKELARKWLGEEHSAEIEERFVAVARSIGYQYEREVRKNGVSVLLAVMVAAGKRNLAEVTKADFATWEAHTTRSRHVASSGVTMAQRVLAAMGHLQGEPPRPLGGPSRERFTWGRTAPAIVATFERFLADFATTRRPGTVDTYHGALRRFGDWLGEFDPTVASVAEVRWSHIEAYKQAVVAMRVGDYATPASLSHAGPRLGQLFSPAFRQRCISCLKTFFEVIDALEYPERPGRQLFLRGDVARLDEALPRFIPDDHWHRFVAAAEGLTPELASALRLPLPFERTRAILGVLLESGLRAGELCRLDTGCLVAAQDAATNQTTYWLRVPVGKLHNDRMIPIRPSLVQLLDAWMRQRGPQPLLWNERTGKRRDYLFAWQGGPLSDHSLDRLIAHVCDHAGIPGYSSHRFRHTLAVQWRKNGMRIETISRMLGHKDLRMTLRYAAVMPETVRQEFDAAFAAIDVEHRSAAQVRVYLSPEAHLIASREWRESLWVDLGIGFCGLTVYLPCQNRLACLPCPHFLPTRENLPLYERQRANLIELRVLGGEHLPPDRRREIADAVGELDRHIADLSQPQSDIPHP